jgi:hypothetical protein
MEEALVEAPQVARRVPSGTSLRGGFELRGSAEYLPKAGGKSGGAG